MFQLLDLYLDGLLDKVVEDKETEDELAGHEEIVLCCDVPEQLDRLERKGRDHAPRRRNFEHNSDRIKQTVVITNRIVKYIYCLSFIILTLMILAKAL